MRSTIASPSKASTVRSAQRSIAGSSSRPVVVNCAVCSARKAATSSSGASRRVATTARQPGEVALRSAFGVNANGIPNGAYVVRQFIADRAGL